MEGRAVAARRRGFRHGCRHAWAGAGFEGAACEDWSASAGNRFFGGRARSRQRCERKAMIDTDHQLPVVRQAQLLELSRSSVYYLPRPASSEDLALMRRIDELHLEYPFSGSRMMRD